MGNLDKNNERKDENHCRGPITRSNLKIEHGLHEVFCNATTTKRNSILNLSLDTIENEFDNSNASS